MQLQADQQAPSRRGRCKAATRLLLVCGAWVIVAVHLFGVDCFGDACRVRWSLGDGWYWLDRS